MILFRLMILFIFVSSFLFSYEKKEDYYIKKTNEKFNSIDDYKVDMTIKLEIPAFRMPKKKYKVYYKRPNKIKVKAKGFGILPKTGLFTSPNDNFDNLTNIKLSDYKDSENIHDIIIICSCHIPCTYAINFTQQLTLYAIGVDRGRLPPNPPLPPS